MAAVNENVQYTLTLKDLLSGKLGEANTAAKGLETTMGAVKSALGFLGVGFALFKGGEFVKESVEKFHELEQAAAQVRAGLASTKGVAGLTFQDVEESAKSLASKIKYSRSEILAMQSILLTFPSITKESFTPASEIIADLSTRLGQDLKSSAIQVGKALQDPIKGVTALRRVGINFNEQQTQMIKNMVLSGHTAQAQAAIMKELRTEVGGSARAAAAADPLFSFNKSMEDFSKNIGEAATSILETLSPVLNTIGDKFNSLGDDIKKFFISFKKGGSGASALHEIYDEVIRLTAFFREIGRVATGWVDLLIGMANRISSGVKFITGNQTGAISDYATAIAAYTKANSLLNPKSDERSEWIKSQMGDFSKNEVVSDILEKNKALKDSFQDGKITVAQYNTSIKELKNELNADWNTGKIKKSDVAAFNMLHAALNNKPSKALGGKVGDEAQVGDISPKGATGQKVVTVNVTIGKLIEQFKISTINMTEGANKVQEMVANVLLGAINDSQIQAGIS